MNKKKSHLDIVNTLFYAGLKKEIYLSVKPLMRQENERIMSSLSFIGTVFGLAMTILSVRGLVSRHVLPAYLTLLISSAVFAMIHGFNRVNGKNNSLLLDYIQMGTVLLYGVMNSAWFAPDPAAIGVTFIVLVSLVPFLLIDVSWRECLLIIGSSCLYLAGVLTCKNVAIQSIETTNTISFCLVACMCSVSFTTRTIQSLADRLYIEKERDTDSLTGLSSRYAGELMIRSQLVRGMQGAFVMMDIDDFKSANDSYGHQFGDKVLAHVGSAISASVRRKDIACRYGGDEFCILLADCTAQDAENIIERINIFLKHAQIGEKAEYTCSFGIALVQPGEDMTDLVRHADEALYQAKRNGKNQSAVFQTEEGKRTG